MRINELDHVLNSMLEPFKEVSDLNLTAGRPMQVEAFGELMPVEIKPAIGELTPFQTEYLAMKLIGGNRRLTEDLLRTGSCDCSYSLGTRCRFRVNIFSQRGNYSVVLRKLTTKIPTIKELHLPDILTKAAKEKTGLILVTGATGSGKSTTLAALLDEVNDTRAVHVITLEDPVEFVHQSRKATFNQRELGQDFDSFSSGLRSALRQSPKIILVGEMRDRHTVEIALNAAETGHLVVSTLHTIDAGQTINRILGMFETDEQEQVRYRLSDTLRWVASMRLAPRIGGGQWALLEIMGNNLRVHESITLGEAEGRSFYEIIEASSTFGWRTFDQSCLEAYEQGLITEETAMLYCTKRGATSRGIDNIKKKRGHATQSFRRLDVKLDHDYAVTPNGRKVADNAKGTGERPPPLTLKLK